MRKTLPLVPLEPAVSLHSAEPDHSVRRGFCGGVALGELLGRITRSFASEALTLAPPLTPTGLGFLLVSHHGPPKVRVSPILRPRAPQTLSVQETLVRSEKSLPLATCGQPDGSPCAPPRVATHLHAPTSDPSSCGETRSHPPSLPAFDSLFVTPMRTQPPRVLANAEIALAVGITLLTEVALVLDKERFVLRQHRREIFVGELAQGLGSQRSGHISRGEVRGFPAERVLDYVGQRARQTVAHTDCRERSDDGRFRTRARPAPQSSVPPLPTQARPSEGSRRTPLPSRRPAGRLHPRRPAYDQPGFLMCALSISVSATQTGPDAAIWLATR